MKVELTSEQKIALEKLQRQSKDHYVRDRIRCVLLASEGRLTKLISQSQRIHETTVQRHLDDWFNEEKLAPKNGGYDSHLDEAQTAELIAYLTNNLFPTTQSIIELVDQWWAVRYTIPGMNKWLHRNGFSYKKPTGVPHKFSAEAQLAFIETYNRLKSEAGDDEPILFIDGVHHTQRTKLAYGWIPKTLKTVVETTDIRTRMNIMGALNLKYIGRTVIREYDTINAENIGRFFIAIREPYPITQKLHIILDGSGYHRSELVKDWASVMNIELHYLPPYSPNLNPIERLCKLMNEWARNNRYFATAKSFKTSVRGFFAQTLPEISETLTRRINDNFQNLHLQVNPV